MRLVDKTKQWNYGKTLEGRKKKYKVVINYSAHPMNKEKPFWYYLLEKDNYRYNSLWNDEKYETQDQCVKAVENKINELAKSK